VLEHHLHRLRQFCLDSLWPGNHQRARAACELGIEQEERQAGEMIAVEVGYQDEIDIVARDAAALQRR
jgi:hypothetical protein